MRITTQRQVILQHLQCLKTHPTADELHACIRQVLPRISLATIYRNLEWLEKQGLIRKIEVGGKQKRFDGNSSDHHHIRCLACGRIDDFELGAAHSLFKGLHEINGYKIVGHRLEFLGICPGCDGKGMSCSTLSD